MIAYSADAELARAYLLRGYNDVDIFVEDSACQNMYVRLFGRMLERKARVNHVFPLHGRSNVIKQCFADQAYRERRRVYIIDGDHDLLLGRKSPTFRNFYKLKVYCAENLLLSERALTFIATEGQTNASWEEMTALLDFQAFLNNSVSLLIPLFVIYAVINKLDLPIESVAYSVIRLLDDPNDAASLSEQRIAVRIEDLRQEILAHSSVSTYNAVLKSINRRLASAKRDHAIYVSAKGYLLPLFQLRLRKVANIRDSLNSIKVRLSQHVELSIDPGLKRALTRAVRIQ